MKGVYCPTSLANALLNLRRRASESAPESVSKSVSESASESAPESAPESARWAAWRGWRGCATVAAVLPYSSDCYAGCPCAWPVPLLFPANFDPPYSMKTPRNWLVVRTSNLLASRFNRSMRTVNRFIRSTLKICNCLVTRKLGGLSSILHKAKERRKTSKAVVRSTSQPGAENLEPLSF